MQFSGLLFPLLWAGISAAQEAIPPFEKHGITHETPALRWDEALPLGNGTLGALVWGDGHPLNISLDRTDLWDLRPVPEFHSEEYRYALMRQWEREGRHDELIALYETPYHRPAPTKIPAGRIELRLPEDAAFSESRLTLHDATTHTVFSNDTHARIWIHALEPVGIIEIRGDAPVSFELKAPPFGGKGDDRPIVAISMGDLSRLGYAPPSVRQGDDFQAFEQEGWGGFRYAAHLCRRNTPDGIFAAWSVASTFEDDDPAALAQRRAEAALDAIEEQRNTHLRWWREFWNRGWVRVPDAAIERQWCLDMYKFGAAARRNAPPITLQGPWTADDGKLPPWKGDYHHNLNTQLSYWPCYSANRLEEGLGFLDWLWEHRANAVAWTRRFFDMPGLNVPMTADLHLKQIGGWRQYTHSATTAAWLAHHFYLHWAYSQDRAFLADRAYPWLYDCAVFLEAITNERDDTGKRALPLSSSPEIHDNRPEAWFPSITNYDCALIRWTFQAAAEMATALGNEQDAARWRKALSEMPPLALDDDGTLLVAEGHPLTESHRHFSHLMAIHPLGLVDTAGGEESARTVHASLRQLERLGTDFWTGYSFSWLASLAARAGDGALAAKALGIFAEAFVLPSSFHCNGDQSGKGYSKFTYRPFTLEGNFAAAAGLQEMLLQSHRGYVELFPAVPESWQDAAFYRLRAKGAFVVSAERRGGGVTRVEILSETGNVPRLRSPWSERIAPVDDAGWQEEARVARQENLWVLEKQ